ncbi:unnamed protein product [Parajaminaea phylloscopi]
MFTAPSSHKRRRASARGDQSRKRLPGRVVLNVAGFQWGTRKGKGKEAEKGAPEDHGAQQRLHDVIRAHPFNHKLTCLLPEAPALNATAGPSHVSESSLNASPLEAIRSLAASSPAVIAKVSLQVFLSPEFVAADVKGGSTVALSLGDLETDDVVCLDGQGMLILHVAKETYQTLGLTGRPSRFALGASGRTGDRKSGPTDRYLIEIPLADPTFRPGKPGWTRVSECFTKWEQRRRSRFTMVFAAESNRTIYLPPAFVTGQSVHVPLQCQETVLADVWLPTFTQEEASSLTVNDWTALRQGFDATGNQEHAGRPSWEQWTEACGDLAEWKALVQRDAECVRTYYRPDQLGTNGYEVPLPRQPGLVRKIEARGLAHPSLLASVEAEIRSHLDNSTAVMPFVLLSNEGFANSPVRWSSHDPGWGLALGQGRSSADTTAGSSALGKPHNGARRHAGIFTRAVAGAEAEAQQEQMTSSGSSSEGESDASEQSTSDDDDDNSDDDDDGGEPARSGVKRATGKAARRKRARQVRRKGHVRQGETERSAMAMAGGGGFGAGASSQGGELGWTAVLFPRSRRGSSNSSSNSDGHQGENVQDGALYIWWENVEGDTRS